MARAFGDGTGKGTMPPKSQGLSHYGGDTADAPKTPSGSGESKIQDSRTTPLKGTGSK